MIRQIHDDFGDVSGFVNSSELPPASSAKLKGIFDDPPSKRKLSIEFAITVDMCARFVIATYMYKLEGNGTTCALPMKSYQN